jgi:uncharacterized protein YjhX (UPF0386 family)
LESSDGIIQGVVHLIRRGGKVASEKRAGKRYFDVAAALSEEGICIFFTLTCCDAWHPLESSDGIIQGVVHLIRRGGKVASEKRAGNRYFDVAAALSEEGICIFFTLTCCDAWHP